MKKQSYKIIEKTYQSAEEISHNLRRLQNIHTSQLVFRREDSQGLDCINQYTLHEVLGEGSCAQVRRASVQIMNREQFYAVKIINMKQMKKQRLFNRDKEGRLVVKDGMMKVLEEIAIMKQIRHPNVVSLHEVIEDSQDNLMYIVLDYAAKGESILWDEQTEQFTSNSISPYNHTSLRYLIRGLIKGLHFIHLHGIVHRDIKPANVLFDTNDNPLLADFGVSTILNQDNQSIKDSQGTDYFMSIESLQGGHDGVLADIWALGVTLYAYAYLTLPFKEHPSKDFQQVIKDTIVTYPKDKDYGQGFEQFLAMFLEKDVKQRPSLIQISRHSWVNQGNSISLEEELIQIKAQASLEKELKEKDIQEAIIPINRVFFMKKVAKQLKDTVQRNKRKQQYN